MCCGTPLWRQSRSEVVRSLPDDSLPSSPGKRPSLICKRWQEQSNSVCFASIFLYFGVAAYIFLRSYLVQLQVRQAGSCVTGISLRIRHCVAIQSQQLLQRKLCSLQGVTGGLMDSRLDKVAYRHNGHFNTRLQSLVTQNYFKVGWFWWKNTSPSLKVLSLVPLNVYYNKLKW